MRTLSQIAALFGVFLIVSGAWVGPADQLRGALRRAETARVLP